PLYDSQHRSLLEFSFEEIERRWGSVDAYLAKEIGVGPAEIVSLRTMYLE
ncbi:MAG: Tyrosine phosphatase family, partial [Phenylobacterium sp.]|nr:Tyrosine phosphatase family [Phenylobacterium sp.]